MEYVEAISLGLLKDTWSCISKCFNYHKILEENRKTLEGKMKRLQARKKDIIDEIKNAQFRRQIARKEVENWLKEVEKWLEEVENWLKKVPTTKEVQTMKGNVGRMEQEVGKGRRFLRLGFLRQSEENIGKVDELIEQKEDVGMMEEEVGKGRCFSRWEFLRQSEENIEKVDELIEQGMFLGGILKTTQLIGDTTAKRNFEKIWTCLEKGEIQSIGVWGMGGIGKTTVVTHIHNQLREKRDAFGPVYWVTMSKESSIHKLQDAIAGQIGLDLSGQKDDIIRSASLFEALQRKTKFVLLLDDMWEVYEPKRVGIPLGVDGGKLILTTRSIEVCQNMGCKEIIKVEPLYEEEAWELFNKTLDRSSSLSQEEEKIARDIVKECAGLPLAIVTTAGSMRVASEVNGIAEWRNALNELREHTRGIVADEMENKVFKILEFSYNRLNDEKIRECLLYCALFLEDYEIRRVFLIKYWIAEGLVEEMGSRQAEFDRGHVFLNKLEYVCLLERCVNGKCLKMHDVIRDMAINITRKNSRFIVKTRRNLEDFPSEIEWSNNVERVSLVDSELSTLTLVPNYPSLSTLFLQNSDGPYEDLPDSFFVHMVGLKVLDLSYTYISFLPNSIYDMVNLRALILCDCERLKHVDSLAKLKNLRELDLSQNHMETIPNGIEKLFFLKKFNWSTYETLPNPLSNLLPNLLKLQFLIFKDERFLGVGVKELSGLRKLEILIVEFTSQHNFNSYMMTQHYRRLTHYQFQLKGKDSRFPGLFNRNPPRFCKKVLLWECKLKEGGKDSDDHQLVLPTNLHFLQMEGCHLPTSLLDVSPSLKIATDVKVCFISRCEGIEYLWWVEDCIASLNTLWLNRLPSLRVLFKLKPTNIVSCSSIKHLYVSDCGNLKHLFTPELVKYHYFQNLQTIHVNSCYQMEDIIAIAAEVEEVEEGINEMNDDLILCFPNLQRLVLIDLPKLKSIWKGTMTCDSLQQLIVAECPELKRLPLSVDIIDGDGEMRTSTLPLKQIEVEKEWWDGVEWDTHPHAKYVFQPLFVDEKLVITTIIDAQDHFMNNIEDIFEEVD